MKDKNSACIELFQRRRRRTWQVIRVWFVLGGLGAGVAAFLASNNGRLEVMGIATVVAFVGFLVSMLSIGVIIFAVNKHYRCPRCNSVPMGGYFHAGFGGIGYESGLQISPKSCPKCKAPLA